ncbi:MAG: DNA polymerase III subunit gamma/tau [Planctomycetes bacterium]|nr:DNA polymerase III subunit gamma/tau [Planctomycetota bacterium]
MARSENYQVLARRFRPRTFTELVGQEAILRSLAGALESGRVPHAFLFSGSRGVGKTTVARILARCLNCVEGVTPAPCGECVQCTSILAGTSGDVLEIDAASHNLVDDIRELRDRVGFASMGARYKVYILDEVHMLTRNAFNAFLKTLEEPPANVVFVLATTELHKVPDTIRSRCQVLLFQRIEEQDIARRLGAICKDEGVALADEVLDEIARSARGGMRDAETALERVLPLARAAGGVFGVEDYRRLMHSTDPHRLLEVLRALFDGQAAPALHLVAELVASGVDEREVLGEVLELLRALLLLKVDGPDSSLVAATGGLRAAQVELADATEVQRLDAMIQAGLLGRERLRRVDDRRLVLEVSVLRMAEAGSLPQLAELVQLLRSGHVPAAVIHGAAVASGSGSAPPPAARAAGGELLPRLLELCRKRRAVLARTLELCRLRGPDADGVVHLALESDLKLHRDRLQSDGVQAELASMLEAACGRPVRVSITLERAAASEAADPPPAQRSSQVEPGAGVRKILDRFDGRIVQVDDDHAVSDDS